MEATEMNMAGMQTVHWTLVCLYVDPIFLCKNICNKG